MNKLLNCIIVILLSFILIACSEKILYLKPEMFGQLYDSRTHKPLSTIHGYIGYDTARDEHNAIVTDVIGGFKIEPEKTTYYFIKPDLRDWYKSAAHIYIQIPGYKIKIFYYSDKYQQQNYQSNSGFKKLEKVNVGIVYLEPE